MFEDLSTFDAENPIVGSLLRELDLKKKYTDSDFIKNLPSQLGKTSVIQKRLDMLKGKTTFPKSNNNNNRGNLPSPVRPVSPPYIDPRPPPLPSPGLGPSNFDPFQPPPPPDPF